MSLLEKLGSFHHIEPSWKGVLLVPTALYTVYTIGVAIHRLYFSNYKKFPGPKLAALSYGYMFYYDAICGGQYMYKIEKLHEEYKTPVIRISPHEVHVLDPEFYEVLFAPAPAKRDRPPTWSRAFGTPGAMFSTIDHETNRMRRNAVAPFFSTASLRKLEHLIQENINRLIAILRQYKSSGQVVPLNAAFSALTSDVISEYCFGINENYIESPGFNVLVMEATDALIAQMHVTVHLQWLPKVLNAIPEKISEVLLGPGIAMFNKYKTLCVRNIKHTMSAKGDYRDTKYRTIFHDILENKHLPPSDKSIDRLWQESQIIMSAGTATTAVSLSAAVVYLLLDSKRLQVLMEELEREMPDVTKPIGDAQLQQLPYLAAVVEETLRLLSGVSYRIARSAPTETLQVGDWVIPPNTALSMHMPLIHHSPTIYPEPMSFIPERWLPNPIPAGLPSRPPNIPTASQRYLHPFARGTRNCIGQPLAYAEIYMTLANLLRNFVSLERDENGNVVGVKGMELFETDRRDTDLKRKYGFSWPEKGRGKIRIIFE